MLPSFATQSIIRLRPPVIDDGHGNDVPDPDLDNATPLTITGCSVQPGASFEDRANREATLTAWTVYAPVDADVRATDAVRYEGTDYRVDGDPQRWPNVQHSVILLQHWEG